MTQYDVVPTGKGAKTWNAVPLLKSWPTPEPKPKAIQPPSASNQLNLTQFLAKSKIKQRSSYLIYYLHFLIWESITIKCWEIRNEISNFSPWGHWSIKPFISGHKYLASPEVSGLVPKNSQAAPQVHPPQLLLLKLWSVGSHLWYVKYLFIDMLINWVSNW